MDQYHPRFDDLDGSIVYFGRLSPIKGLETLVDAVRDLPAKVKIIGSGELEGHLRARIEKEKLGNVSLPGRLEGKALYDEVGKSLFALVPSECYENSPFAAMEAFALGKPVIGSSLGGIPELIGEDERGLLFKAGDALELRAKIEQLLGKKEKIETLGRAARAYAEECFDMERYYGELMRHIAELMGEKRNAW
jgi:glycosyltransferase involved in cell wall biosynthesis